MSEQEKTIIITNKSTILHKRFIYIRIAFIILLGCICLIGFGLYANAKLITKPLPLPVLQKAQQVNYAEQNNGKTHITTYILNPDTVSDNYDDIVYAAKIRYIGQLTADGWDMHNITEQGEYDISKPVFSYDVMGLFGQYLTINGSVCSSHIKISGQRIDSKTTHVIIQQNILGPC